MPSLQGELQLLAMIQRTEEQVGTHKVVLVLGEVVGGHAHEVRRTGPVVSRYEFRVGAAGYLVQSVLLAADGRRPRDERFWLDLKIQGIPGEFSGVDAG
jgi:hypothetical protein